MDAKPKLRLAMAVATCMLPSSVFSQTTVAQLEASYQFLTSDRTNQGGILYTGSAGALKGRALPLSFHDSAEYWGEYVCRLPNTSCAVIDVYNPADHTLQPVSGASGDLQTERVNTHNGANIYDAASWQIAVTLGAVVNRFLDSDAAYALANNQNALLQAGHDGEADAAISGTNRAVTRGKLFLYNGHAMNKPEQAYAFRMLARDWLSPDPFMGTRYQPWITASGLPAQAPEYQLGKLSWSDWKPVTGENAWAFLIGPLQAAYLHFVQDKHGFVPFHDVAVQNALKVLPAFAAMQAPLGAVYYAPVGTIGNQGRPVNPYEVSVENNVSLYAGLKILEATLVVTRANEKALEASEQNAITAAINTIDVMISGGQTAGNRPTAGLLAFFKNTAWRNGEFMQGGWANDPQLSRDWTPNLETQAVDVNTWGIAALGAKQIDAWFGFGAAYKNWQQLKSWGAYGVKNNLWGVGYSNHDGNGMNADGAYRQGVLSSEWTAGAINMVRNLIAQYQSIAKDSADHALARQYLTALKQDEAAMLIAIQNLRVDRYQSSDFPDKPARYSSLIKTQSGAYLYASKRHFIPFGWYANPLPSTCATAWMLMIADRYDPFGYAGKPN